MTLFCSGIPGTGKTMIASIAVNHLKTYFADNKTGIAFLYCVYKRQDNQGVDDLLASLLGQLAVCQSMVPESICEFYDKHRKGEKPRLSQKEIREELRSITKTYSRAFIIIDALDECKTDHIRNDLLSEIYKLQEGSDTRLMVTFRPSVVPERPSSVTEQEIQAHEEDIEEYLRGRMAELRSVVRNNNKLQCRIKSHILSLVDGMYVQLQSPWSDLLIAFQGSSLHNSISTHLQTNSRKRKLILH